MIGDAASSIGIVIASIIILYTNFNILDPIVSIGISMVILYWAWSVLKESTRILLEMAPKGLNIDTINDDLKNNFKEIMEIYNVHLWTITPDMLIFSAYIKLKDDEKVNQMNLISEINNYLYKKFYIIESTVQIIPYDNDSEACKI